MKKLLEIFLICSSMQTALADTASLSAAQIEQAKVYIASLKKGEAPKIKDFTGEPGKTEEQFKIFKAAREAYGTYRRNEIDPVIQAVIGILEINPPRGLKIEVAKNPPSEIVIRGSATYFEISSEGQKPVYIRESKFDAIGRYDFFDSSQIEQIDRADKELETHKY